MPTLPLERTDRSAAEVESFTTNLLEPLAESKVAAMSPAIAGVVKVRKVIKAANTIVILNEAQRSEESNPNEILRPFGLRMTAIFISPTNIPTPNNPNPQNIRKTRKRESWLDMGFNVMLYLVSKERRTT